MKTIIIIVRPNVVPRLMDVLGALPEINLVGVKEVRGYGRQKSYLDEYQGSEYSEAYIPKVFIDLRVRDEFLETLVDKVVEVTRTGRMGDGKIFILGGQESEHEA